MASDKHFFTNTDGDTECTITVKKRKFPWWIFLILLALIAIPIVLYSLYRVGQTVAGMFQGQSGDIRVNLQWYDETDLDLHVIDPCGHEIFFSDTKARCHGGKGELDVDANVSGGSTSPQENCFFVSPATGEYKVKVIYYGKGGYGDAPCNVRFNLTVIDSRIHDTVNIPGVIQNVEDELEVYRFTVTPPPAASDTLSANR